MSEHNFHITVQMRTGAGWLVVAEQPAFADLLPLRHEEMVTPAEGEALFARLREVAGRPPIYGHELGRAVLRGEIGEAWAAAVGKADVLHVFLTPEAPEWQGLRWEWLCVPIDGGTDFADLTQRTPTSFDVPSASDRRFPPIGRRALRALVVAASPIDENSSRYQLPTFDGSGIATVIRDVLVKVGIPADILSWDPVTRAPPAGAVGPPTLDTILQTLTGGAFTLLHVACHGHQTPGGPVIYLSDQANRTRPVPVEELLQGLRRVGGAAALPRLAFLSVCDSGSDESLPALARRLVFDLGMPAVVAMRASVTQETAGRLAANFYRRLTEHGAVDLALAEARVGLFDRADVHVPFLYGRLGRRTLFTTANDGPLTSAELLRGLDRLRAVIDARAPVLRVAFDEPATAARTATELDLGDPSRLAGTQAVERLNEICGEVLGITLTGLARGPDPDTSPQDCPFRGLAPFRSKDEKFFFGRERLTAELVERLVSERVLAVLGRSGCGKSSLIFAGVVPLWQAANPGLRIATFSPDTVDPLAALADAFATQRTGLIVVDQFERLLTRYAGAARRAFLARLLAAGGHGDWQLLLGIRADFLGECADHPVLRITVQDHHALVGPLEPEELRTAVERQALAGGVRLEAGLVARMFAEVGNEPAAMSLVQLTLLELWRRRHGPWLLNAELDKLGGVRQAVARAAESAYERLPAAVRSRSRDLFLRLVQVDATDPHRDTRERVSLSALVPAGVSTAETRELVRQLSSEAPLLTVGDGDDPAVEIVHDALLRGWPRLRDEWVDKNRRALRLRTVLSRDAAEWAVSRQAGKGSGDRSRLWRGSRLTEAEQLRAGGSVPLSHVELDFIAAAVGQRKRRGWYVGLATVALVGLVLFAAVREYVSVRSSLVKEQRDFRFANARRLAAQSLLASERPGKLALLLAVAASTATREDGIVLPEADAALLRAIADQGGLPLSMPAGESPGPLAGRRNGQGVFLATTPVQPNKIPGPGVGPESGSSVYEVGVARPSAFGPPKRVFTVDKTIQAITVSRSGRWLVAETNRDAYVHDLEAGDHEPVRIGITAENSSWFYSGQKARMTEDDRWVVTGVDVTTSPKSRTLVPLRLWRLADGKRDALSVESAVSAVTADGRWLVAERGGQFTAYDLATDAPSAAATPLPRTTRHVTTAGDRIGVIDADGRFGYFDPALADQGLTEPVLLDPRKCAGGAFLSPDARWLISLGDGAWWMWRLATRGVNAPVRVAKESSWPAVHYSPGGDWAAVSTGGELHLARLRLDQPESQIYQLPRNFRANGGFRAFSPDGHWLVTAENDERRSTIVGTDKPLIDARLWDLSRPGATGSDVPLRGGGFCNVAAFDPGGQWLVTGGASVPRLYPLRTDGRLAAARLLCDRNLTRAEWDEFFPGIEYRKTFDDLPDSNNGP